MPSPKTIQSTVAFQDPQGNVLANGILVLTLSAPSEIIGGGGQVVPTQMVVVLTSAGVIPNSTVLWANDQLLPNNTVYGVSIFNSNGLLVSGPMFWSITGSSPIDLSQEVPVSNATLSFSLPGFNQQAFTSSGTFTIPNAITKVKATVVAAGGAGGGSDGTHIGTGGGSGGSGIGYLTGLTPGNTITVTVGVGGTGVNAATGNAGGNSSISSGTQTIATITANGGSGGFFGASASIPIQGGNGGAVGSGGTFNDAGQQGYSSNQNTVSGAGAASILGGGGAATSGATGAAGLSPGSGGAGSTSNTGTGGAGANGLVIFEWVA